MKPLWNSPSLGTLRAGPQQAITFVVVAIGWGLLVPLLLLAPLWPVVRSAWRKQPRWIWRGAVIGSIGAAAAVVLPISPLFIGFYIPFAGPADPLASRTAFVVSVLVPWINLSLVAEVVLLPLVAATTIHSAFTRGTQPRRPTGESSAA